MIDPTASMRHSILKHPLPVVWPCGMRLEVVGTFADGCRSRRQDRRSAKASMRLAASALSRGNGPSWITRR